MKRGLQTLPTKFNVFRHQLRQTAAFSTIPAPSSTREEPSSSITTAKKLIDYLQTKEAYVPEAVLSYINVVRSLTESISDLTDTIEGWSYEDWFLAMLAILRLQNQHPLTVDPSSFEEGSIIRDKVRLERALWSCTAFFLTASPCRSNNYSASVAHYS